MNATERASDSRTPAPLSQIAISVVDLKRTHGWYQQLFGYLPAGGTRLFRGPLASLIQGLPKAASTCWWLVDQQDYFQLEMFQFKSPSVAPLPADYRPCDIGYSMVGIHVVDFDGFLARLSEFDISPMSPPKTFNGARRVCIRDPEGVVLEIMEDDPRNTCPGSRTRSNVPVVTRSIRISVENLEKSRRFFVDALGLVEEHDLVLHTPEHEVLWGLPGAECKSLLLWAGDFLVELVQYCNPLGKPRPANSRISDQGLLNIALGFRSKKALDNIYNRCEAMGYKANSRPIHFGCWAVTYVNDDQDFSVELLFVRPWYDRFMGFLPKPKNSIAVEMLLAAPLAQVWDGLIDHEAMVEWWPLKKVSLIKEGSDSRNGPGAVRYMQGPGMSLKEEVVSWNPPYSYEYRLLAGAPLKDHCGVVTLSEKQGQTRLRWIIRFNPVIPGTGWLVALVLRHMITGVLKKFKRLLERQVLDWEAKSEK